MTATITEFRTEAADHAVGRNLTHRIGRALWMPMLLMALMSFPVGLILGIARAARVADGAAERTVVALGHFVPAFIFLGFASVFAAISFAIAKILGEFRVGGSRVQEAAKRRVEILRTPGTAKLFILLMAAGMMVLLVAVALHLVVGTAVAAGSAYALDRASQWGVWLEGARRIGVAVYLFAISFGLATIITVLRFQAARIRELPEEARIG